MDVVQSLSVCYLCCTNSVMTELMTEELPVVVMSESCLYFHYSNADSSRRNQGTRRTDSQFFVSLHRNII